LSTSSPRNEIRIHGTRSYVLAELRNNDDLQAMGLATSEEWIFSRTGLRGAESPHPMSAPRTYPSKPDSTPLANSELVPPMEATKEITPFAPPGEAAVRPTGRHLGSYRDSDTEGDLFR